MRPHLYLPWFLILSLVMAGCAFAAVSTASIRTAQLQKEYDAESNALGAPTTVFSPSDHVFHLVVEVANATVETRVGATWYGVDAGSLKNQKLDSKEVTVQGDQNIAHFTLMNTKDWPQGKYKVDLSLDGKADRTLEFQVQ